MTPSAVYATLLLWIVLAGVAIGLLDVAPLPAVLGGLAATLLHWVGEMWHQFGHAWAARRTGYPMTGVRLWTLLGISLYPRDEPPLPAATHIRRALGGPAGSLLMALVAAVITWLLQPAGGAAYLVALFFFLDNLLVFTLGAFLPLGFTDGSTILTWWRKSRQPLIDGGG